MSKPDYWTRRPKFQQQAGDEARRLSAHDEAQSHYNHALTLLDQLPTSGLRTTQRMVLQTAVLQPQIQQKGFSAPDVFALLERIHEAATHPHLSVLYGLVMGAIWAGNGRLFAQWYQQLSVAATDPPSQIAAQAANGQLALLQGDFDKAQDAFQAAIAIAGGVESNLLITNYWQDIAAICEMRLALIQDLVGNREAARETAVSILAQPHPHPQTQATILHDAAWLAMRWGETAVVADHVRALNALAYEQDMRHWQAVGTVFMGWVLTKRGNHEDGAAQISEGKAECEKLNLRLWFEGEL